MMGARSTRVVNALRALGSRTRHRAWKGLALLSAAAVLTSCAKWHGIANVPMPGGPGSGPGSYTVYVQIPDTLALNDNSRVRVADVFVGTVRAIELKNWVATVTLRLDKNIKLPKNATAKIGQTSLLGSQHIELAAPPNPSPEATEGRRHHPAENSSTYPTTEQTLGKSRHRAARRRHPEPRSAAERGLQHRERAGRPDPCVPRQAGHLHRPTRRATRRHHPSHRFHQPAAGLRGPRSDVLDRVLTEFPPLIKHFADKQNLLINAVDATGRLSQVADQYLSASRGDLHQDLLSLQCPLRELGRAAPYLIRALKLILVRPFDVDSVPKAFRGDYFNLSLTLDLTLSAVDNAVLTGTGFSGALRALEQSWGRDPETMIPDVRYTPNPNDVPGGPLVERADRQC